MRKRAKPANTLDQTLDREIGERAASALVVESPLDAMSAPDMNPLEAALMDLSKDIRNLLYLAGHLKKQGESLESFARLLAADMERVKTATAGSRTGN
jgi:hypothetical protein